MADPELDAVDEGIIYQLQVNARDLTTAHIGEQVGVSSSTVGNRIGKLEERGVLTGYYPTVDYEKAGLDHHLAVVGTIPFEEQAATVDRLARVRGVVSIRKFLTNKRNVFVEVVGRDRADVARSLAALARSGVTVERTEIALGEITRPFDNFGERTRDDT